jgi:hypothetical protein
MKKNMGNTDKIVRISAAVLFFVLYFTGAVSGVLGTVLLVLGGVFLATWFISFCPLYTLFGINSCSAEKSQIRQKVNLSSLPRLG